MREPDKRYGSSEPQTEYEGQRRQEPTHRFVRSAWSMVVVVGFLIVVLIGLLMNWPEGQPNTQPDGNTGSLLPPAADPGQPAK